MPWNVIPTSILIHQFFSLLIFQVILHVSKMVKDKHTYQWSDAMTLLDWVQEVSRFLYISP